MSYNLGTAQGDIRIKSDLSGIDQAKQGMGELDQSQQNAAESTKRAGAAGLGAELPSPRVLEWLLMRLLILSLPSRTLRL